MKQLFCAHISYMFINCMTRSFKILCHCCNVIFIMSNVCCPLCDCGTNCRHVCVWVGKKKTSWSIYIKTLCIFCLIPRIMNGKTSNARGIPWLVFFPCNDFFLQRRFRSPEYRLRLFTLYFYGIVIALILLMLTW